MEGSFDNEHLFVIYKNKVTSVFVFVRSHSLSLTPSSTTPILDTIFFLW